MVHIDWTLCVPPASGSKHQGPNPPLPAADTCKGDNFHFSRCGRVEPGENDAGRIRYVMMCEWRVYRASLCLSFLSFEHLSNILGEYAVASSPYIERPMTDTERYTPREDDAHQNSVICILPAQVAIYERSDYSSGGRK